MNLVQSHICKGRLPRIEDDVREQCTDCCDVSVSHFPLVLREV